MGEEEEVGGDGHRCADDVQDGDRAGAGHRPAGGASDPAPGPLGLWRGQPLGAEDLDYLEEEEAEVVQILSLSRPPSLW